MMFNFGYLAPYTREVKIIVSILTCVLIYLCAKIQELPPMFVVISLVIGFGIHFLRKFSSKINADRSNNHFGVLLWILPLLIIVGLIISLPQQNQFFLALQSIGFIAIGILITSIQTHRAKRYE